MKKYFKIDMYLKTVLKIFILTFIIGTSALILSSIIPNDRIDKNIEKSVAKMNKEGAYPTFMKADNPYFKVDNWTDAAFLNFMYSCKSNTPLKCVFAQPYYSGGKTALENVNNLIKETSPNSNFQGEKVGYYILRSSYWLGARIIYRPLLAFVDYYAIRYIMIAVAVFLSIFTIIKIAEKLNWRYSIAFGGAILATNYFIGLFVSSHALTYILTFLSIDYLLLSKKKTNYFHFMFLIGMLTTYFDWFSSPLITWGFPVIIILLKEYSKNKNMKFYEYFNIIFQTGLAWCLGYALLLIFRVLFSYLVAGKEALAYFTERVSSNTGMGTAILNNIYIAVSRCINGIIPLSIKNISRPITFAIGGGVLYFISIIASIYLIRRKRKIGFPLLIISLSPFAWIITFNGFHVVHYWFAYRSIGIFIFAILSGFMIFTQELVEQLKRTKKWQNWIIKIKKTNFLRYIATGCIAILIDYIIYMVISSYINLNISKCISIIFSCIFLFIVNKNWPFRIKEKINTKILVSYFSIQIINISLNTFINYTMFTLTSRKTISFVVATFIAMIVNYLLQIQFVLKEVKTDEILDCNSMLQ